VSRKPPAKPDADDLNLFRDAIGKVRRIGHDLADQRTEPPPPLPRQSMADARAVMRELKDKPLAELELELGDPVAYVHDGVAPRILRRLGRGEYAVRDELDLHQMTVAVATRALTDFLAENRKNGKLCLKIIHGKGLRSKGAGPVLKQLTERLLRQRGDVLAFRSARAMDGGSGAVIVLLRRDA
jgi:DNA-nicking Smr family endonuclease